MNGGLLVSRCPATHPVLLDSRGLGYVSCFRSSRQGDGRITFSLRSFNWDYTVTKVKLLAMHHVNGALSADEAGRLADGLESCVVSARLLNPELCRRGPI